MTKHQYLLKRANLLIELENAEKFNCKHVIKDTTAQLKHLEEKFKKEHLFNPLFSYFVGKEEMDELIENDSKPTFEVKVTFKDGESYDLMFYHEIKKGTKYSAIENWAKKQLANSINHPENIVGAKFIMGRG